MSDPLDLVWLQGFQLTQMQFGTGCVGKPVCEPVTISPAFPDFNAWRSLQIRSQIRPQVQFQPDSEAPHVCPHKRGCSHQLTFILF